MTTRVTFLIDGFNLYHSICEAIQAHALPGGKWLNIRALCASYLHLFGRDAVLQEVYYFSALATHHRDPDAPVRHQTLIAALRSTGVQPIMGTFKRKRIKCRASCKLEGWGYEEKETDVNIAVKLIELLMLNSCDVPVIVSGDTDLATAIRAAKRLFPAAKIGVGFPYKRFHHELKQLADFSFKMSPRQYSTFVFPDQVVLPSGKTILKPPAW